MGTSFLDAMFEAATKAGVANWQKCRYWLEVSFKGYNEDGSLNNNLMGSGLSNGGKWKWPIVIGDIDTVMDVTGGTYTFSGYISHESALEDHVVKIPDQYQIEAETVGDFFNKLTAAINKTVQLKYATDLYSYKVQFHPYKGKDPSGWKLIVPADEKKNPFNHLGMTEGNKKVPTSNLVRGTNMNDIITEVLAITKEGQDFIRDADGKITDEGLGNGSFREALVWNVYPEIKYTGYDDISGNYKKQIIFHVKGFRTQKTTLIATETRDYKNSQPALNAIASRMKKKYEYIYTGLNTEILSLNINFKFNWQAALPRLEGFGYYNENMQQYAQYNPKAKRPVEDLEKKRQAAAQAREGLEAMQAQSVSGVLANNERTLDRTLALIGDTQSELEKSRLEQQAARQQQYVGTGNYAEDLTDSPLSAKNPFVTSVSQMGEGARRAAGTGLVGQWNRRKSIFGAILEQAYEPIGNSMMSIAFSVRGDPYWLGEDYTAFFKDSSGSGQLPDYSEGDACFFLTFRYPYNFGEGSTPQFRDQDVFSGVYRVLKVTHTFSEGVFKQEFEAAKQVLINPADVKKTMGTTTT